jgi:protein involved in polysaccharide export with SLBB domain
MAEARSLIPNADGGQKEKDQVEIDLTDLYQGRPVPLLMLPMRDGDRIFVPQSGQVFVEGWVEKPSPYDLLPAMTLTQAVTKAGGLHFAASPASVTLSREDREGIRHDYRVDYAALASGLEKDIYLQPGDHIYVGGNPAKVGVWGVYNVFATIVRVSVGGAIALF